MNDATTPLVVGTIAIVGVGSVVTEHKVNMKAVVAGGIVVLGLSAISNVNEKLAALFAALLFAGAAYKFVPPIVEAAGFANGGSGNDIDMSKAVAKPSTVTASAPSTGPVVQPAYTATPAGPGQASPQLGGATAQDGMVWT